MLFLRASLWREDDTLAGVCVLESNCSWLKSWHSFLLTVWPQVASFFTYVTQGLFKLRQEMLKG